MDTVHIEGDSNHSRRKAGIAIGLAMLFLLTFVTVVSAGRSWTATATQAQSPVKAHSLGRLNGDTPMRIAVGLKLHDQQALGAFIRNVQTKGSPSYNDFLTPAQFTNRYAPTAAEADAVVKYLKNQGFHGIAVEPNRLYVTATGTAATAERAFDTRLEQFKQSGVVVYANTQPARVPAALGNTVAAVLGLNSTARMSVPQRAKPADTVGTLKGYYAPDYWKAYHAGSTTGSKTTIAIFAAGDVTQVVKDLRTYEKDAHNNLPKVPVSVVKVGLPSSDTAAQGEWDMDTQTSTGIAGTVKKLYLYDTTSLTDIDVGLMFNRFATQNVARAGSASFGECEYQAYLDGFMLINDEVMSQAAAQGQTVFASSGDTGSFCPVAPNNGVPLGAPDVNYPASSPYVVSVGGTTLLANADGTYNDELAWVAGGGGPSYFEYEPEWQRDTTVPTGDTCVEAVACLGRNIPDVAMDSDPNTGAIVYVSGATEQIGGTSLGSPLALGVWARLESAWGNTLGFASPRLYRMAGSAGYHDVTKGDIGIYPATPGWDYATGLGSFDITAAAKLVGKPITKPSAPAVSLAKPACKVVGDAAFDAPSFETGDQVTALDIRAVGLNSNATSVTATIAVTSLNDGLAGRPSLGGDGDNWYVIWTYQGIKHFLSAQYLGTTPDANDPTLLVDYSYGTVDTTATGGSLYNNGGSATGTLDQAKGVITITTPLTTVGSPRAGESLTASAGETLESIGTPAGGLLEAVDSAGPGTTHRVGSHC